MEIELFYKEYAKFMSLDIQKRSETNPLEYVEAVIAVKDGSTKCRLRGAIGTHTKPLKLDL